MSQSNNKHSFSSDAREFERLSRKRYRSERTGGHHTRKSTRSQHRPSHAKTDTSRTRSKPHKRASESKSNAGVVFTPKNIRSDSTLSTYDSHRPVIGGIGVIVQKILIAVAILLVLALLMVGTRFISQQANRSSANTLMILEEKISAEATDTSDEASEEDSDTDSTTDVSDDAPEETSTTDATDSSDDSA